MTGRNMVNEMRIKNTPVAINTPKHIRDFPEGKLLAADWMFPGRSLTPFETLTSIKNDYMTGKEVNCNTETSNKYNHTSKNH